MKPSNNAISIEAETLLRTLLFQLFFKFLLLLSADSTLVSLLLHGEHLSPLFSCVGTIEHLQLVFVVIHESFLLLFGETFDLRTVLGTLLSLSKSLLQLFSLVSHLLHIFLLAAE